MISDSSYDYITDTYTKLMDKNESLTEENERLKKCYDITNESWKELQIENAKLHRIIKYIQRIINKPFSVYLISKPEYNHLKNLVSDLDIENLEVVNEEMDCSDISNNVSSDNGNLSSSTGSI